MPTNSKKIFIDTNVLIYHSFEDFDEEKHKDAHIGLEYLAENNYEIFVSSQVLREFFAIATNEKFFKRQLNKEFEDNFTVLFDTRSSLSELRQIVIKYQIKKQDVHDANIVATMITNGIKNIFSFNRKDFIYYKEIKHFEMPHSK